MPIGNCRCRVALAGKKLLLLLSSMKKLEIQALWENYPELFRRAVEMERNAAPSLKKIKGLGRNWSWESYYEQFMRNKQSEDSQITFDDLFPDTPGGCICGAPCGCYDG